MDRFGRVFRFVQRFYNVSGQSPFEHFGCRLQFTLKSLGIDFVSYQENIDTSSPLGGAIFTIISAVAQLERDIIAERVRAGLRRARDNGTQLGRPRSRVDRKRLRRLRDEGLSLRQIEERTGVSRTTVSEILRGF